MSLVSPSQPTPLLSIRSLRKAFGSNEVLCDVSFDVPQGGIVSILGRSGTGKSVLLRCIVGLHQPDAGRILFAGQDVALPPFRAPLHRASSYVFQQNALFDAATVLENMLLPLRARGEPLCESHLLKAKDLLRRLELEDASNRYPAQLSGGMQKRLAVARALVTDPDLVFFDEPTAGLDPIRRNSVFELITQLQSERKFTAILVTHDVPEALLISTHLVWLDNGHAIFSGSPAQFEAQHDPKFRLFRDNLEALRLSLRDR